MKIENLKGERIHLPELPLGGRRGPLAARQEQRAGYGGDAHHHRPDGNARPCLRHRRSDTTMHVIDAFARKVADRSGPARYANISGKGLEHWQRGSAGQLTDRALAIIKHGAVGPRRRRKAGMPVYKLIGGYRDKVPAYGSTMCGDETRRAASPPPMNTHAFAEKLVARGYKGHQAAYMDAAGVVRAERGDGHQSLRRRARGGGPGHRADAGWISLV